MKTNKVLAALVATALSVWSCQKNDANDSSLGTMSTAESVDLAASIDDVDGYLDETIFYASNFIDFNGTVGKGDHHDRSGFFSSCTTFVMETVDNTTTVTIGFEPDCTDRNGNTLSGTATLSWTRTDTSRERSVTFADFTVNGYVVNGTKSFSYTNSNDNGNREMSSNVDITIVTDSGTISKVGTKLVEVTAGSDTDICLDDEITTTGSSTYTAADGTVMSMTIITPLVRPAECRYIASGIKEYTNAGETSTLDYGDGTCDDQATLTEPDGTLTEITLHRGRHGRGH
ncbi:MAG: hypothetical protein MUO53_14105 [Maribacter sp.]|nr:hypothetical protein [Maribacter sp.]